jgi:hypothetical protein
MLLARTDTRLRISHGQHPAQAGCAVGALIGSEQGDRRRLVGLQHVEAAGDEQEQEDAADHRGKRSGAPRLLDRRHTQMNKATAPSPTSSIG